MAFRATGPGRTVFLALPDECVGVHSTICYSSFLVYVIVVNIDRKWN